MDVMRELFLEGTFRHTHLWEAGRFIRFGSLKGGVWFIGGFVYRNITAMLYHIPLSTSDVDIMVETLEDIRPPRDGWSEVKTSYGSPRYRKDNFQVDFIPLDTVVSIRRRGLPPTIENYITGVPLTVQSIAFDVRDGSLIGDISRTAIRERIIRVNDIEQARYEAGKKKKTVNQIIREKAESLNFKPVYIDE